MKNLERWDGKRDGFFIRFFCAPAVKAPVETEVDILVVNRLLQCSVFLGKPQWSSGQDI
jgi:hypothetical protein